MASYAWSFGDGTTASGATVSHTYAAKGSYPITLTVTDAAGNATTRTATTLVAAPVPQIALFKLKKKTIATDEKTKLKVRLNTASTLKLVFKSKHQHVVKGKKKYVKVVVRKRLPAGLSKITVKAKVKGKVLNPDTYVAEGRGHELLGEEPEEEGAAARRPTLTREATMTGAAPQALVRVGTVSVLALLGALLVVPAVAVPTWLAPVPLSSGAADSKWQDVAVTPQGDAIAVWTADGVAQSSWLPAGGQWSAPVDLSDPSDFTQETYVAVDAAGNATVVWRQVTGPGVVIMARSRTAAGVWDDPQPLSGVGAFRPTVAVDPQGSATVAWYQDVPMSVDNIVWAARRPAGGTWQAAQMMSAAGPVVDPSLAADAGIVALAWKDSTSGVGVIRASVRSATGVWSADVSLSAPGEHADGPQAVVDPSGIVTVGWRRDNGAHYVVQAATRSSAGGWGPVQDLSDAAEGSAAPDLGVAGDGAVTAAWRTTVVAATVKTAVRPAGGTWGPPVTISDAAEAAGDPAVAVDALGDTVVTWSSSVPDSIVDSVLAATRAAGGAFGAPVVLSPSALFDQTAPRVAADTAGNAVAVFQRYDAGHYVVKAETLDGAPPTIAAFSAPTSGTAGKPLAYSASGTDTWSPVASYTWSFGDGTSASGPAVAHTFAEKGGYPVTLTVTDAVGNNTTRTATTAVAAPVPHIALFKLKKRTIATDEKTKLKVRLNTGSTLKLVFRSKHQHLVKGKKKYLKIVLTKRVPDRTSKVTIRGKKLAPDTWKLVGKAKNSTGTSPRKKTKLIVVRADKG